MERSVRGNSRGLYTALAAALCVAATAGIVALLVADSYSVPLTVGYTAGALLAFGLAVAAGMSITGGFPFAWIGWLCVIVTVTGFGFTMRLLWDSDEIFSEALMKATGSVSVFSLALALVSLTLGRLRPGDGALVRQLVALTFFATLATATLLTIAIVGDIDDEPYFRATGVVAVLAVLGTALVPVLSAARRAA